MKSFSLFLIVSVCINLSSAFSQRISNVHTEQKGNYIYIYYDLDSRDQREKFDVQAFCQVDGGRDEFQLNTVSGDVGQDVGNGTSKRIVWDVLKDVESLEGDDITFVVRATPKGQSPVTYIRGEITPQPQKIEMVYVEGASFNMGSRKGKGNEQPVHLVTLDDFYISKYEITNAQYVDFLNEVGRRNAKEYIEINSRASRIKERDGRFSVEAGFENYPVTTLSWIGANAYCEWIGGRLPTEAEWEYAARGGRKSMDYRYSGSNDHKDAGWSERNARHGIQPVGQKVPNELGLYDMSGNLWEWVNDVYDRNYYQKSPENNPKGPSSDGYRVLRGGSFEVDSWYMRPTYRLRLNPKTQTEVLGCRCAK